MSKSLATDRPRLKTGSGMIEDVRIENSAPALMAALSSHGMARGFIVLWQMQNVLWGRLENGRISFADCPAGGEPAAQTALDGVPSEYWQELRVFNEDAELRLTRRGGELVGRFRSDAGGGTPVEYVDAMSRLWGERDDQTPAPNGYVHLIDRDRGLSMTVPSDDAAPAWYGLVTRNYVKADPDTSQAGYADYRFVRIVGADMKGE